ncbi:serine/arginine repetitive matrix protein 1 isoform X2 [Nematostella vectensis]|uniref:serine/arginine repetitive matrix protein 1 isoform X2 n=1 Tax=Nematostella vectensis TaxID=45351 RepID=UPI0020770DF9|nr:serine/arginine repetitive matrix protein 1 isoform X2 [Nematostella vectensis]
MAGRTMPPLVWILLVVLWSVTDARPREYRQTSGCPRGVVLNSPGTIASPNYPGTYPDNSSCTWVIKAPRDHTVTLRFGSMFNIMSVPTCGKDGCQCDYLELFSSNNTVQRFCDFRNDPPRVIDTNDREVKLVFKSDADEGGKGFSLSYEFAPMESDEPKSTPAEFTAQVATPEEYTNNVEAQIKDGKPKTARQETEEPINESGTEAPDDNPRTGDPSRPYLLYDNGTRVLHQKGGEGKEEEEKDPPDEIVLGPAIPIILIFLGVVGSIAWWNFRSDKKERMRYEEISMRGRPMKKKKKGKKNLREIRTNNLYNEMARTWRDQTQQTPVAKPSTLERPPRDSSLAGRLLELAERPMAMLTPKSSRPSSMVATAEQQVPLVIMREKKGSRPASARMSGSHLGPTGRPQSRPASMLLRDALNMIFGTQEQAAAVAALRDQGGTPDSKRSSNRISYCERIAEQQEDEKEEGEQTALLEPEPQALPSIMISQPSVTPTHGTTPSTPKIPPPVKPKPKRQKPAPKPDVTSEKTSANKPEVTTEPEVQHKAHGHETPVHEPEVTIAEVHHDESEAFDFAALEAMDDEEEKKQPPHDPEEGRPISFESKLVGMLEQLQKEGEELEKAEREMEKDAEGAEAPKQAESPEVKELRTPQPTPVADTPSPGGGRLPRRVRRERPAFRSRWP